MNVTDGQADRRTNVIISRFADSANCAVKTIILANVSAYSDGYGFLYIFPECILLQEQFFTRRLLLCLMHFIFNNFGWNCALQIMAETNIYITNKKFPEAIYSLAPTYHS